MYRETFPLRPDEHFWGGTVENGVKMPFDADSTITVDLRTNGVENQTSPLLISDKGRYFYSEKPYSFAFDRGTLTIECECAVECADGYGDLRRCYHAAMQKHFPFDGTPLEQTFFRVPQFNTWMQFTYFPTQEGVMEYARGILKNGFRPGILIIDEGWHKPYGDWSFDPVRFPDPKEMVRALHEMGFLVMLWVAPYVTSSGYRYVTDLRYDEDRDRLFMRTKDNKVAIVEWWNGCSAILDMTKDCDRRYLKKQLDALISEYGVDGFKFDGGSSEGYRMVINGALSADATEFERSQAWNLFGREYPFHENKNTYAQGGVNMIERLQDKKHSWHANGINALIPNTLCMGLFGMPFVCPDMIGGGEWTIRHSGQPIDGELVVRMAQCSALFPMMQFSMAPWEVLDEEHLRLCLEAAALHDRFVPYILTLVEDSVHSGEPIVQHLEYAFPGQGFAKENEKFMLGDRYLVAPVIEKGQTEMTIRLPHGNWKYVNGEVLSGTVTVPTPLSVLPYFERIDPLDA